jgi:hypothetical protein
MSEGILVRAVLDALKAKGVWAWRNQSGALVLGTGKSRRFFRQGEAGGPDIFAVKPLDVKRTPLMLDGNGNFESDRVGTLMAIECKTIKGKQSATQKAWQVKAERHGVRYAVVRSVGEALRAVGIQERRSA